MGEDDDSNDRVAIDGFRCIIGGGSVDPLLVSEGISTENLHAVTKPTTQRSGQLLPDFSAWWTRDDNDDAEDTFLPQAASNHTHYYCRGGELCHNRGGVVPVDERET